MSNWNKLLGSVIPRPCYQRPFVCDGFPSQSSTIVIGENPATPMHEDWWLYWHSATGFNYEHFMEMYRVKREKKGKGISNTRRRLIRFRENGVLCVETNAFANEKLNGAGKGISNYAVLMLLMRNMPRLKAIIAHGKVAQRFMFHANIPDSIAQYPVRHFRTEKYAVIDSICNKIAHAE